MPERLLRASVTMAPDCRSNVAADGGSAEARVGPPRRIRRDRYPDYATLARCETEGVDYRIIDRPVRRSPIAIVAPHGGGIERGTSGVATLFAGEVFSLYLFEGLKRDNNFNSLHITSRRFDEPRCLALLARHETVITVHGCVGAGEFVCLGGLHEALKQAIAASLRDGGFDARTEGHNFPALDPDNLCNRGRGRRGVQIELSAGFRRRMQYRELAGRLQATLLAMLPPQG